MNDTMPDNPPAWAVQAIVDVFKLFNDDVDQDDPGDISDMWVPTDGGAAKAANIVAEAAPSTSEELHYKMDVIKRECKDVLATHAEVVEVLEGHKKRRTYITRAGVTALLAKLKATHP